MQFDFEGSLFMIKHFKVKQIQQNYSQFSNLFKFIFMIY